MIPSFTYILNLDFIYELIYEINFYSLDFHLLMKLMEKKNSCSEQKGNLHYYNYGQWTLD